MDVPLRALDSSIGDRFEVQVRRVPQSIAIASKNYQWTYQTLNSRVNATANYILNSCHNGLERIALLLEHDAPAIASILAVLKLGKIYIPLDPTYPISRLKYILQDSQPQIILTNNRNWDLAQKITQGKIAIVNIDNLECPTTVSNLVLSISPEAPAYILYTSGSTGLPKGVVQNHRNILHFIRAYSNNLHITGADKLTLLSSYSFDAAIIDIFAALLNGATLCPFDLKQESFASLGKWLTQEKVTIYHSTSTTYRQLVETLTETTVAGQTQLDWIRFVVLGGEAVFKTDVDAYKRYFPPDCLLMNLMGCSESSFNFQHVIDKKTEIPGKVVPVGYPVEETELLLLDEVGKPALGLGEIAICSAYIALGYWQKPELTETVFLPAPEGGKRRIYRSGDLGRLRPDGTLEFLGRQDFQVKIRGFRVELGEIEATLGQHPKVLSVVATSREDSPGNPRLVAYIVPDRKLVPTISELRSFLSERLPDYMVPSAFVMLDALPLTPNNKIDRLALPAPEASRAQLSTPFVRPSSHSQEVLADIWSALLGVEVGIHDNFFELGGHSLKATQIISRVRETFSVELSLRQIFECPTIAQMAETIEALRLKAESGLQLPEIVPEPRNEDIPLSFAQQRLWFLDQLQGKSATYNLPMAIRLDGSLNFTALEAALREIVRRHEVLRTTFKTENGSPVQVIAPTPNLNFPVIDLRELPAASQESEVQRLSSGEEIAPFDLAVGPLLRVKVLHLSAESNILLLTMHHIVSDGWSFEVFFHELEALYQAFCQNQPSPLPELPVQYTDFTLWQHRHLTPLALQNQLSYWKQQLSGAPSLLELPTDRPRPMVQRFLGRRFYFLISEELTEKLVALARQTNTTLFMILLAAFSTLLYRYSGQEDIVVGSAIANRNRKSIEPLIGFFVNTLAMRTSWAANPKFSEVLERVRQISLDADARQDLPFEQLVEALQPERNLSYAPLFQVMFVWQNAPELPKLQGLNANELLLERANALFDITLSMEQHPEGLRGYWEYNTDLFDAATIERMMGHFQTLLGAIAANPEGRVGELRLLTAAERHQLLVEWNDTFAEYPQDKCIHQLFEEQVERTPDAVAVVFEEERLTYRELNAKANQLAHYLQSLGVGPEVLVGICVERSIEMIVGLLGILKAGGAYLPLDPDYPSDRLAYMLSDSGLKILLTQQELRERLPQQEVQVVCLDSDWGASSPTQSESNPIAIASADKLAYINYTSGSTGKPKGVEVTHRGVTSLLFGTDYINFSDSEKFLHLAPIAFDASTFEIWGALLHGGQCVLFPEKVPTSKTLGNAIRQHGITTLFITTALLNAIVDDDPVALSGIRQLLTGGEAHSSARIGKALEALPSTEIANLYGPTEATTFACYYPIPRVIDKSIQSIPIGRPIANTQIYILDNYLQPVPIGVPGELHIGGAGLARGYLNRPELTYQKFIPNPFSDKPSSRLYKTGDLTRYLPDGNIEFISRIDNQVKIRGFRIELGEIEATLAQHPKVREAVVIVRSDSPGDKQLVAYLVQNSSQPTISQLRSFLKSKIPSYMVPSAFVFLEVMPLTPNGKIDRRTLPAPDSSSFGSSTLKIAPRTPTEELIAAIWAEVLGLEKVGTDENFFEIGGHSLKAMQAIARIGDTFSIQLPVRELFQLPTIAELAQWIETAWNETATESQLPAIAPKARDADIPLSFAQQRLWFLDQLEGKSATYNIPQAIRLDGSLDVAALEAALKEILRRHEVLRTNFQVKNGIPFQVIAPASNLNIPVIDLQQFPQAIRESEVQRLVLEAASEPFNLVTESLMRFSLLRVNADSNVLLLTIHHIVADGWSMGVLFGELQVLYEAFSQNKPSPLPELSVQYADFAIWQRQYLTSEHLKANLNYWKQNLAGIPPLLELPTDRPRPRVQRFRGATASFALSVELTQTLLAVSQKHSATLFMTLLAAFSTLLYRYSGQEDLVVGSPIANRNRPEIESLIGFFVNTLVLRTSLAENPSFVSLLHRVRETCLDAYSHRHLPFEQLVEELQPERNNYAPLCQVMFVLQNTGDERIGEGWELPGLKVSRLATDNATAKFDLTLSMEETEARLIGYWEYNTDLFDAATIERMAGHFQTLLEAIAVNPEARVGELPLLTAAESHQLLVEWNDTRASYPQDKCVHQLFEERVKQTPDAVAAIFESEQMTYRELNERANQLAHYMRSLGVETKQPIAICLERSLEMLVGLLGILKAGCAYVPLDPSYPLDRLVYILSNSGASALVTYEKFIPQLPAALGCIICLDTEWQNIVTQSKIDPLSVNGNEDLAYIIYTSGSTGKPKGVAMPHNALVNLLKWQLEQTTINREAKTLQFAPIGFDVSFQEIFSTWYGGGTLVLLSEDVRRDPMALLRLLAEQQVERLFLPFVALQQLAEIADISDLVPQSLREIVTAGEQLQITPAISRLFDRLNCTLQNQYGPSESHVVTAFILKDNPIHWPLLPPIGRPIANTQIYILDARLQPVPIGVPGEIHIGGAGLARGYLGRPELTSQKFVPNPFSEELGSRLYKTGDKARYLPNGNIEFISRIDNQVKIRGFRIELGEIEATLAQHPEVREAVVIVREDSPGEKRLVAYIVPEAEEELAASVLRSFLKSKLPDYMVPGAIVFLEAIPLTPNAKVNRRALPAPDGDNLSESASFIPPRTNTELQLSQIWSEVLNVTPVGVTNNFFDLGGHSLLAVRLMARIERQLGIHLPLATLFAESTIESQANLLSANSEVRSLSPLVPIQASGELPPLFCVHPIGGNVLCYAELARHLGKNQPFYGLQSLGLSGEKEPLTEIESMAAIYIEALKEIQANGPYYLGGWSMGGVVAWEMARQLLSLGQEVALVALIDSYTPIAASLEVEQIDEATLANSLAADLGAMFGIELPISANDDSQQLQPEDQLQSIFAAAKCRNLLPPEVGIEQMRRLFQVFKANRIALANYQPQPYSGRVALFSASEPQEDQGWSSLAAEEFPTYVIPGDHYGMMQQPHVRVLAQKLEACLNQGQ